jgi:hypothetical protein
VAYSTKIEFQIAPLADAQRPAEACHAKFGVRELALAFIAQCPHQTLIATDSPTRIVILSDQQESKGLSSRSRSLKLFSPRFLIANLELEFLASRTKLSLLTFPNRKKIAFFHPCPSSRRPRRIIRPHISDRNSRFIEFRSTYYKHAPYQISNRNKNAHFAFSDSTSASHQSHAATREPRPTTRAAFRSTIPARPHADR